MSKRKTWDEIDASPLLKLSPEQRARLHAENDEQFRAFWADCFMTVLESGKDREDLNSEAFCKVFLNAFDSWTPKQEQTFSIYLRSAIKHELNHIRLNEQNNGFKRETNRKIKKALEYMSNYGLTENMLFQNPDAAKTVAQTAGVGVKTLLEALRNKASVLSLDNTGEADTSLYNYLPDSSETVEQMMEHGETLQWLRQGIGLMDLKTKEKYGKSSGALWSSVLMGYLRNEDKVPPSEDTPTRLANCEDLRPLEEDNCLWDILLLRSYVAFTVCPPYTPKELEHAALNELLQPDRNPAQDKTVAEFLGVSKAAVSQQRKTWRKKILQLKSKYEEF